MPSENYHNLVVAQPKEGKRPPISKELAMRLPEYPAEQVHTIR